VVVLTAVIALVAAILARLAWAEGMRGCWHGCARIVWVWIDNET
jgi:hypothetical protein